MGLYIETPEKKGKAGQLIKLYGAEEYEISLIDLSCVPQGKVLICVVMNPGFDAALIVGDQHELDRVNNSKKAGDERPTRWLLMDWDKVIELNPRAKRFFEERARMCSHPDCATKGEVDHGFHTFDR